MARVVSFGGDYSSLPIAMRRAHEADRSYVDQARCTTDTGKPKMIWTAEAERTYVIGDQKFKGETLNELAALECELCPVQWECAIAAIVAGEPIGVWGDTADRLRRFQHMHPDAIPALQAARVTRVTVRVTVAKVLAVA